MTNETEASNDGTADSEQTRRSSHCYPPFPNHAGALELQHNEFKSDYSTAEKWIADCDEIGEDGGIAVPDWESEDAKQRAIDTDEVWTLHWYPNTPIGFHYIAAPTFSELLKFAESCG